MLENGGNLKKLSLENLPKKDRQISISDTTSEAVIDNVVPDTAAKMLRAAIDRLDPKEQEIIIYTFRLFGRPYRDRIWLAERFGISPTRVQQLELRAIRKLSRNNPGLRELSGAILGDDDSPTTYDSQRELRSLREDSRKRHAEGLNDDKLLTEARKRVAENK